jgi:DNA-binding MarR family transcriptional regulator
MSETAPHNPLPAFSGGNRTEFHILAHNLSRLLTTIFDRSLKPLNITRAQWWALCILDIPRDSELNQSDLAIAMSSTKASVGKLLGKIEEAGFLKRVPNPEDQRAQFLKVTAEGKKLLRQTSNIESKLAADINKGIPRDSIELACEVLIKAKENIQKKGGKTPETIQTTHLVEEIEHSSGQNHPNFIGFLVHDVARMRQSIMDRVLHPEGLTRSLWWVLSFLNERDGMTQSALANELELSRSALGTFIQKLEQHHYITRLADPEDARKFRILITKAGAGKVRKIRSKTSKTEDFVLSNISKENIGETISVMEKMKENIHLLLNYR